MLASFRLPGCVFQQTTWIRPCSLGFCVPAEDAAGKRTPKSFTTQYIFTSWYSCSYEISA